MQSSQASLTRNKEPPSLGRGMTSCSRSIVQVTTADKDSHFNHTLLLLSLQPIERIWRPLMFNEKKQQNKQSKQKRSYHQGSPPGPYGNIAYYRGESSAVSGSFSVQSTCPEWFQLYRSLWRRDGNVVSLFHFHVTRKF